MERLILLVCPALLGLAVLGQGRAAAQIADQFGRLTGPSDALQTQLDSPGATADILNREFPPDTPLASGPSMSLELGEKTKRSLARVVGALALVLALLVAVTWVSRRRSRARPQTLPGQVVQVIGHAPLNPTQRLQLIRLGSKLVLVASSAEKTEPLSEITDPQEVQQIEQLCSQSGAEGLSSIFSALSRRNRRGGRQLWASSGRVGSPTDSGTTVFEA